MNEPIKARCTCTLEKIREGEWSKPADGYLEPDPTCEKCGGKGFKEATVVCGDDAIETYTGVCVICGDYNGVAFVYKEEDREHLQHDPPYCMNEACANFKGPVQWVEERDMN